MRKFFVVFLCLFSATMVMAQPPGGGGGITGGRTGGGGGDVTINPDVPDIEDVDLQSRGDIDVDINSEALRGSANFPTVQPGENAGATIISELDIEFDSDTFTSMMDEFEIPENWADIDLSAQMPNFEDIQALRDELPEDIDLDNLDIRAESDPEATSAILGYASSMLGANVTVLYAGEYGDSDLTSNPAAQETIGQIYGELPADMQSLLTQADSLSGVTYWALLQDGLALLYTGDCDLEQCTISKDALQVEITGGSAGGYAIYSDTIPSTADEAKALIQSIYPRLANINLAETESDYGTAFFAFDIDAQSGSVTAYYAGVYGSDAGKSIVYVVSGVGDAYINVLLGG